MITQDKYVGSLKFIAEPENNYYRLNSLIVYDNSISTAEKLSNTFFDKGTLLPGCNKTILFAKTQSGKTVVSAVSCNIIIDKLLQQGYSEKDLDCYYFSNLSSNQLRNQNAKDFALTNIDQKCRFKSGHLSNYKKIIDELEHKDENRPQVVVIDESHIANHEESKFEELITKFEDRFTNVLVIYVSATPYSLLAINYLPGNQKYNVVVYHPGENYKGIKYLLEAGNLKSTKQVVDSYTARDEKNGLGVKGELYLTDFGKKVIKEYMDNFDQGNKGNLVIRLTGKKAENIEDLVKEYMNSLGKYPFKDYTYDDVSSTANGGDSKLDLINIAPNIYRIYIIRGAARAGIRIENKNAISMFVESTTRQNDSVAQAGIGRFTGYGLLPNSIIYTHLDSVKTVAEFNKQIFDNQSSSIDLQDWFPSSAHHKPSIRLERQYKITFELLTEEVEQRLEEEKQAFNQRYRIEEKDKQARFEVKSSSYNQRYYDDLEMLIDSNFTVHDNCVTSKVSPIRKKSLLNEYGYLDGSSIKKQEWKERYDTIVKSLCSKKVKTINASLLKPDHYYVISVEELPRTLITTPTTVENISEKLSKEI